MCEGKGCLSHDTCWGAVQCAGEEEVSMKRFAPIVFVLLGYAFLSAFLLLLPPVTWFKLNAFYLVSWPASHLVARQPLVAMFALGCVQWALIASVCVFLFRKT